MVATHFLTVPTADVPEFRGLESRGGVPPKDDFIPSIPQGRNNTALVAVIIDTSDDNIDAET